MKNDEKEIAEMRKEIANLRRQVEQQAVASMDTELTAPKQHVCDKSKPAGLRPELGSFYAAKQSEWKHHPHNESWARRNGYRPATPDDFVEGGGMTADEMYEAAMGVYGTNVLYVCPREHQEARQRDAERRSAIAANQKLPEFHGPDGRATVEDMTNGTSRQP